MSKVVVLKMLVYQELHPGSGGLQTTTTKKIVTSV